MKSDPRLVLETAACILDPASIRGNTVMINQVWLTCRWQLWKSWHHRSVDSSWLAGSDETTRFNVAHTRLDDASSTVNKSQYLLFIATGALANAPLSNVYTLMFQHCLTFTFLTTVAISDLWQLCVDCKLHISVNNDARKQENWRRFCCVAAFRFTWCV